jgi:hypothetical protein
LYSFSFAATPGLTYLVERGSSVNSLNKFDWAPVVTNVASGNSIFFSDSLTTDFSRFYRVGRLPNP